MAAVSRPRTSSEAARRCSAPWHAPGNCSSSGSWLGSRFCAYNAHLIQRGRIVRTRHAWQPGHTWTSNSCQDAPCFEPASRGTVACALPLAPSLQTLVGPCRRLQTSYRYVDRWASPILAGSLCQRGPDMDGMGRSSSICAVDCPWQLRVTPAQSRPRPASLTSVACIHNFRTRQIPRLLACHSTTRSQCRHVRVVPNHCSVCRRGHGAEGPSFPRLVRAVYTS
jgi:hypothetical protein